MGSTYVRWMLVPRRRPSLSLLLQTCTRRTIELCSVDAESLNGVHPVQDHCGFLDADSLTWLSAGPLDDSRLAQLDLVEVPTQVKTITSATMLNRVCLNPVKSNDFQIGPQSARRALASKAASFSRSLRRLECKRWSPEIRERDGWHDRRTNERLSCSTLP